MFYAKDFIETAEGLVFAVVASGVEQGKVLCFLRYVKAGACWNKVSTEQANALLKQSHPDYLHYSTVLDAFLHAVPVERIVKHHQPKQRLQQLMRAGQHDAIERDLLELAGLFRQHGLDLTHTGITGSILIRAQNRDSDIDWVCYGRAVFHQCRTITRTLVKQGQLSELGDNDWRHAYRRRSAELSFADYVWHERRKNNKAVINGRKFDLNFIDPSGQADTTHYQKCAAATLRCKITDDTHAFDYPALFAIDHEEISAVVSFTATYTGQAVIGETIEVSGMIEQTGHGAKRIVVGSSREAQGEYIRVIRD